MFVPFALYGQGISIDLNSGWNMFGYVCPDPVELTLGLSQYEDLIVILKNNEGSVFMPEFGFNGVGDLVPGFGYQVKLSEPVENFNLCEWYALDQSGLDAFSILDSLDYMSPYFGCTDYSACNYNLNALVNNNSCIYPEYNFDCDGSCNNVLACNYGSFEACEFPDPDYDCDGNPFVEVEIGDFAHGGYVFYLSPNGQRGLVAASEYVTINGDLDWQWSYLCPNSPAYSFENYNFNYRQSGLVSNYDINNDVLPQNFHWLGNYDTNIQWDDYVEGYNYTNCITDNNIIPIVSNYNLNNYEDWFIPSFKEMELLGDNLYEFHLSSPPSTNSESDYLCANYGLKSGWVSTPDIRLEDGTRMLSDPPCYGAMTSFFGEVKIRPKYVNSQNYLCSLNEYQGYPNSSSLLLIRAFGNWDQQCYNRLACNSYHLTHDNLYGILINNELCEFPDEGFDCEGNPILEVGELYLGGKVFYVDSSGVHGLVAFESDSTAIDWGCNGFMVGAENTNVGSGLINTNIVYNQCLLSSSNGCSNSNAVSLALEFSAVETLNWWNYSQSPQEYSDWFLPSKDELELISLNGVVELDENEFYWSSSEYGENFAWGLNGATGIMEIRQKFFTGKIIVVRSF